jgi:hypothetical protein
MSQLDKDREYYKIEKRHLFHVFLCYNNFIDLIALIIK